jgi:hypothetical protein
LNQLRRHLDDNGRTYIAASLRADMDALWKDGEMNGVSELLSTPLLSMYPPVLHVAKFIGSIPPKFSSRTRVIPPTAKPKGRTPRHLLKKLKEDQKSGKVALAQEETSETLAAMKWRFEDQVCTSSLHTLAGYQIWNVCDTVNRMQSDHLRAHVKLHLQHMLWLLVNVLNHNMLCYYFG